MKHYFLGAKVTDLFTELLPYDKTLSRNWSGCMQRTDDILIYCNVRGSDHYSSFLARPTPKLIEFVKDHMLRNVWDDNIFFNFVFRDDGSVLITASYSMIIGSRWLTEVKVKDIKEYKAKTSKKKEKVGK